MHLGGRWPSRRRRSRICLLSAGLAPRPLDPNPASRHELLALAAYFTALEVFADILNVRLGVELMTVAVAAPALLRGLLHQFLADWWFLLVGLVLWNLSGPIGHFTPFPLHLGFMLDGDKLLFGGQVPAVVLQHRLASSGVNALDVATAIAYNMHLQEPYIAGYFVWRVSRPVYFQFAAATLVLLVAGFVTFLLFPAIPPWMAATKYHVISGVTNRFGPVLRANPLPFHGTPIFYLFQFQGDAVAAFPSEHAAFPLLEFLFVRLVAPRIALVLLAWTVWILFSVLYLGEHWLTDAVAGYVYALADYWIVRVVVTSSPAPPA